MKQQRLKDARNNGIDVEATKKRILETKKERKDVLGQPVDWEDPKRKRWLREKRLDEARQRGLDVDEEKKRIEESNKRAEAQEVLGNPVDWEEPKRKEWLREKRIEEARERGDSSRVREAVEGREDVGL